MNIENGYNAEEAHFRKQNEEALAKIRDQDKYLIWWLDQPSLETVNKLPIADRIPKYAAKEIESAMGRAGRGRLWNSFDDAPDVEWDADHPMSSVACFCAGIVILKEDLKTVACLPGFVTDYEMNLATI